MEIIHISESSSGDYVYRYEKRAKSHRQSGVTITSGRKLQHSEKFAKNLLKLVSAQPGVKTVHVAIDHIHG